MKIGKTIIQIYSVWGMFGAVLLILLGLGLGIFGSFVPDYSAILPIGGMFLVGLGAVMLYIDYNLFKFKDWARLVVSAFIGLNLVTGLFTATISIFVLIDVFILYLMWMDKDTAKLFKK